MGPPTGPCAPDSHTSGRVCSDKDSKAVRKSGRGQHGTISHSGSKRPAQHAEYHNAENKRRQEGAERAANVQKHATQLVQQLAAPGGQRTPKEMSGTLAKAEDRQSTYNMSIDTKPWASGRDNVSHAISPTAGRPMQTGHYCDTDASSGQPTTAHAPLDTARDGSPVQQTNSDPSDRAAQLQADSSEGNTEAGKGHSGAGSQSPPTSDHPKFSSTQKFKSDKESSPSMSAIKDRQIHEQTHQHHPQNRSESGKSLPPVIEKLQLAQQRAHDELEAAEKESSDYKFPAEAGERFVSNARKNKAKLDVAVYEHRGSAHTRASMQ